ncbi:hypothetical protein KUTeg_013766 [Tegillarca granosa]|uniref:Prohormone-4 n=1 Tax=Tegillarca granosa TaxID=220873 RepID=A0ABQ9EZ48_TEGGR|nr:hypothetical protein KUTeg_013766 [Tegillarca granosa]
MRVVLSMLNVLMRAVGRQELIVVVFSLLFACVYGMKVDFSRLRQIRKPFLADKRSGDCTGNPCPADKPFLCKTQSKCIALENVCDHNMNCDDGFDENPALCNAISSDIEELKLMLGIGGEAEHNLHDAFMAVMEGDERPLLKLGMPEEEWYDVQYNLNKLIEGGLQV